jgi:hypothetical protein
MLTGLLFRNKESLRQRAAVFLAKLVPRTHVGPMPSTEPATGAPLLEAMTEAVIAG